MFCTEKERKTCNVEKMGCEGCYYNKDLEEDIKILENLKENVALFSGGWRPILKQEEIQAIENLINRNKELEEENRRFKRIDEIVENMTIEEIDKRIKEDEEEFIPKSKVEAKKEEYKKLLMSCNRFSDVDRIKAINERILAYEELLEEERIKCVNIVEEKKNT